MGHRSLMDTSRMQGRAGGSWESAQVPCAPQKPHRRIELNENSCYLNVTRPLVWETREFLRTTAIPASSAADHECVEPDQIPLFPCRREPEPNYSVLTTADS